MGSGSINSQQQLVWVGGHEGASAFPARTTGTRNGKQGEDAALIGIVRTVTATLTSSVARPIIDVTPIPVHTNEMGVFGLALDALRNAYRGIELFTLVTYDAGACSAHNATLVRARDWHYLFGLTARQPPR